MRPGSAADHSHPSKRRAIPLPPPTLGHNRACNGITLPLPLPLHNTQVEDRSLRLKLEKRTRGIYKLVDCIKIYIITIKEDYLIMF